MAFSTRIAALCLVLAAGAVASPSGHLRAQACSASNQQELQNAMSNSGCPVVTVGSDISVTQPIIVTRPVTIQGIGASPLSNQQQQLFVIYGEGSVDFIDPYDSH